MRWLFPTVLWNFAKGVLIVGLQRVTFDASSKIERTCAEAFSGTDVDYLAIPDSVVELGDRCFSWCGCVQCVIFGSSSSPEHIGREAFLSENLDSLAIPDSAVDLCDNCLWAQVDTLQLIWHVISSSAFFQPNTVIDLGDRCCFRCKKPHCLKFGA